MRFVYSFAFLTSTHCLASSIPRLQDPTSSVGASEELVNTLGDNDLDSFEIGADFELGIIEFPQDEQGVGLSPARFKRENSLDKSAAPSGDHVIDYNLNDLGALFLALESENLGAEWDDFNGYKFFDDSVLSSVDIGENRERILRIDTSSYEPAEGVTDTEISPPDSTTSGGIINSEISKRLLFPSVAPYTMAVDVIRRNPQTRLSGFRISHPHLIDQITAILNFRLLPYQYMNKILEVLNRKNDANTRAIQAAIRKVDGTPKFLWLDIWRRLCTAIVDGVVVATCKGSPVTIRIDDGRVVQCHNMDTEKWIRALEIWGEDMAVHRGAEFSFYDSTREVGAAHRPGRERRGSPQRLSGSKRKVSEGRQPVPVVIDFKNFTLFYLRSHLLAEPEAVIGELAPLGFEDDRLAIIQYVNEVQSKYIMPAELHWMIMNKILHEDASDDEIALSIPLEQSVSPERIAEWRKLCIEPLFRFNVVRNRVDEPPCKEIFFPLEDGSGVCVAFELSDDQKLQLLNSLTLGLYKL